MHPTSPAGYLAFGCSDGTVGMFETHTQNSIIYPVRWAGGWGPLHAWQPQAGVPLMG